MQQRSLQLAVLAAFSLAFMLAAGAASAANELVTLCHVLPGDDPKSTQQIVVTEGALAAHLKNHPDDQVGTCQARCESVGACNDGNPCTVDACHPDGSCDNSQPVDCDDGEVCTLDACDPQSGCVNPPVPDADQLACDDGNGCSEGDVCVAGACTGTATPGCCTTDTDCPASDACTTRYCEDATSTCKEMDLSGQCSAGACQVAVCDPVSGCGTAPVTCADDGDICTIVQCNPVICGDEGGCETLPNPDPPEPGAEVSCDDGLDNDCDGLVDGDDALDCIGSCPCFTVEQLEASAETECGAFSFSGSQLIVSGPAGSFRASFTSGIPGSLTTCESPTTGSLEIDLEQGQDCAAILEDVLGPCEITTQSP